MKRTHIHIVFTTAILFWAVYGLSQESSPGKTGKSIFDLSVWGELYNQSTVFEQNDDNLIAFSHIRQGMKAAGVFGMTVESYLLVSYGKDLHRDYWNNRAELGFGIRIRTLKKVFLAPYFEWIKGYYIKVPEGYSQAYEDTYRDFRTGLIFWYGWRKPLPQKPFVSFTFRTWGDIYSAITYFQSQRNNVIGYTHLKTGFQMIRIWKSSLDIYGVLYITKDINKDFWNNKAEFGPGIWFKPIPGVSIKFFIEWLYGRYFGLEGADTNPYDQKYTDRRMGLIFWIGW
jgi:hypothetical protein